MKNKVAVARSASMGVAAAAAILALPRGTKRLIMATTDAVAIPTALWAALVLKFDRLVASHQIPLSAFGIYGAFALLYVGGSRFVARYLFVHTTNGKPVARVAIYGAGDAGARVSSVLLGGPDFEPVAFIDDKRSLQGSNINGIRVHGSDCLPELVRRRKIDRILLAMPTASRRRRREILPQLEPLGVAGQSLPNLSDLISGKAQINELRDVDVGDLLGRDPG